MSCSSIESGSSFEDYVVSEVDDNNNNESDRFCNNNKHTSTVVQVGGLTPTTNNLPVVGKEDTNNNTVVTPTAEEEDLTNNNKPNTPEKDIQKEAKRSKNSTPGRTRLLDEDGFIRRAACVCVDETESNVSTKHLCAGGRNDHAIYDNIWEGTNQYLHQLLVLYMLVSLLVDLRISYEY